MIFRNNSDASAKLPWDANSVPYSLGPSIAISSTTIFTATRAGLGASHQPGWTGLVAKMIQQQGEFGTIAR